MRSHLVLVILQSKAMTVFRTSRQANFHTVIIEPWHRTMGEGERGLGTQVTHPKDLEHLRSGAERDVASSDPRRKGKPLTSG